MRDLVASAETVVGIDAGARAIEEDVALDDRLCCLGLPQQSLYLGLPQQSLGRQAVGAVSLQQSLAVRNDRDESGISAIWIFFWTFSPN